MGQGPDVLGEEDFAYLLADTVQDVIGRPQRFPVGTVVRRRLDFVTRRT